MGRVVGDGGARKDAALVNQACAFALRGGVRTALDVPVEAGNDISVGGALEIFGLFL